MADIVRYAYRVEHEHKAAWKELIYRAMDRNFPGMLRHMHMRSYMINW